MTSMSLKGFHVVFIAAATLLAFAVAAWCFTAPPQPPGLGRIAAGAAALAAAAGLAGYETWFVRKMRRLP